MWLAVNRAEGEMFAGVFFCRKCVFLVESGFLVVIWMAAGLNWGLLEVKWGLCYCRGLNHARTERAD